MFVTNRTIVATRPAWPRLLAAAALSLILASSTAAQPEFQSLLEQHSTTAALTLAMMDETEKSNATISCELPGNADTELLAAADVAAALWNAGDYEAAIAQIEGIETTGTPVAVSIQWITPLTPTLRWADRRIGGTRTSPQVVTLDHDRLSGVLYSVVAWPNGWSVNRSSNGGATWAETYFWSGTSIVDLDARVAGDYLYTGYIWSVDAGELRVRRAAVSDGASDATFGTGGYAVVHDAGAATISEVAVSSNADWLNNRIYYFLRSSDDAARFYFAATTSPATFTERSTGVTDAAGGIDLHANPGYATYFLFASYISTAASVNVIRLNTSDVWSGPIVIESTFAGFTQRTAISAYDEAVICAYETPGSGNYGIGYDISYDAGNNWSVGSLYTPPSGGDSGFSADVTARGGFGTAVIYGLEAGVIDPLRYQTRSGYAPGVWTAAQTRNDFDIISGAHNAIDWIPPRVSSPGSYSYGMVYISDPPYFERADVCTSDLNGDDQVGAQDLALLLSAYLTVPGDPHWNPAADLSGDNVVSAQDLAYLLADYPKTCN